MSRATEGTPPLGRRSLIAGGGAVVAGVLGAGAVAAATAAPAAAVASGGFVPIAPYRCYDSRQDSFGKVTTGLTVHIQAYTSINLNEPDKFDPATAIAITYNLTVTSTESRGYLSVYPGNTTQGNTLSTLNWVEANVDLANGGTVALGTSARSGAGSVLVYLGGMSNARTHFILDVTGYYA